MQERFEVRVRRLGLTLATRLTRAEHQVEYLRLQHSNELSVVGSAPYRSYTASTSYQLAANHGRELDDAAELSRTLQLQAKNLASTVDSLNAARDELRAKLAALELSLDEARHRGQRTRNQLVAGAAAEQQA